MKKVVFLLNFIIVLAIQGYGQGNNERYKRLGTNEFPALLDSLSIIPESLHVGEAPGTTLQYDPNSGMVSLDELPQLDSITVFYKVFPFALNDTYVNKSLAVYDSNAVFKVKSKTNESLGIGKREELFVTEDLYKSGVLSRGISFGNRQDIFVNSVLNLQMEGKLSDNLNIRASITDQNIPYQPEGNTKLVQDFDNIYFEMFNDNVTIAGGDIILRNQPSYFMRYNRNVQGGRVGVQYKINEKNSAESQIAASVTKGKFASAKIEVLDGVVGPYKIQGPRNEGYIIILANSEKVFLDGVLLVRGYNNDYVIDYNTAEITFTNRILITKYSRVTIDFEYTNQAYSRAVVNAGHKQQLGKMDINVQFYQEKDNKNKPLAFQLSDLEKSILGSTSALNGSAIIPGWDSIGYFDERILYKQIDTIDLDERNSQIFRHSQSPDSAVYQVVFSEVQPGEGDYVQKITYQNGKVYEWISPQNGLKQGNYIPMKIIPLPSKKQMLNIGTAYNITRNDKVFTELALSGYNDNLYNLEVQDKGGVAFKTGIVTKDRKIGFLPGVDFAGQVDYEYVGKSFTPIDRFRSVEYDRNWSYNPELNKSNEPDHILNFTGSINHNKRDYLNMGLSRRLLPGAVNGWQSYANGMVDKSILGISGDFFMMKNEAGLFNSNWIRYKINSFIKTKFFFPGYQYQVDRNAISPLKSDSVISTAMNFDEHLFYIKNNDSLKTKMNLSYSIRKDRLPQHGEFEDHNLARTLNTSVGTGNDKIGKLNFTLTYREIKNLFLKEAPEENSLMGRLDWFSSFLNNHINSELSYAIGNGRELKREYIFVQVPNGEGTHTWRDDNGDGIQDLTEFYLAINNDERNYIKLFTPTDDYVLAYVNNINYRLNLDMPRKWKSQYGIKRVMSKFSNVLSIRAQQKIARDQIWNNLIFDRSGLVGQELLSFNENYRNTLFFNRSDPRYGFEMVYNRLSNRQLLMNGYESRSKVNLKWNGRVNIQRDYSLRVEVGKSGLESNSDYLEGRNFEINSNSFNSVLEWQPSNFFRLSTNYQLGLNNNVKTETDIPEESKINEAGVSLKYSRASDKNINFGIKYTKIDFSGIENSPVGYELLRGLKPGDNVSWAVGWQQKLFSGLQMNISYEGRKSGDLDIIHIGRMQVMALF